MAMHTGWKVCLISLDPIIFQVATIPLSWKRRKGPVLEHALYFGKIFYILAHYELITMLNVFINIFSFKLNANLTE